MNRKRPGISILEVLLALSIIGMLSVLLIPGSVWLGQKYNREQTQDIVLSRLQHARMLSMYRASDSNWGVFLQTDSMTVFAGENFENRIPDEDRVTHFPASIAIDALEVTFDEHGRPSLSQTIPFLFSDESLSERSLLIHNNGRLEFIDDTNAISLLTP